MTTFFQWVRKNSALSYFLGIQIISLTFGIVWAIGLSLDGPADEKQASAITVPVITEEAAQDFVKLALQEFAPLSKVQYPIVLTSRENALQEFEKNEHAILILTKELSAEELNALNIDPGRLPIQQEVIDNSSGTDIHSPIFVTDKKWSEAEDRLADFLNSNQAQDIVFQKLYQKPPKADRRKG